MEKEVTVNDIIDFMGVEPDYWDDTEEVWGRARGEHHKTRLESKDIPQKAGVYAIALWGKDKVIYVGKATNMRNRLQSYDNPRHKHFQRKQSHTATTDYWRQMYPDYPLFQILAWLETDNRPRELMEVDLLKRFNFPENTLGNVWA